MRPLYEQIINSFNQNRPAALCTLVYTKGSTPRKTGAKMIVYEDGSTYGTIGGGNLEYKVIEDAISCLKENKSRLFRHHLLQELNMCCGGTVDIFIEPMAKRNNLYIFGAGHVGRSLASLAGRLDFDILLLDDRPLQEETDDSPKTIIKPFEQVLYDLPFDEHTYICIMTYDHPTDRQILAYCLKQPFAYLGMIGSKRKAEATRKMFREAGTATEEEMSRVDMPMGISIGAEGPDEIAVSMLARLIEVKNKSLT